MSRDNSEDDGARTAIVQLDLIDNEDHNTCTDTNTEQTEKQRTSPLDKLLDIITNIEQATSALYSPNILSFNDISVSSKTSPDLVLNNVSGEIGQEFCAIMGPSNSGKTALVGCLSFRLNPMHMTVEGEILLNNSTQNILMNSVFVMLDDLLLPDLTVLETLSRAAKLRLRKLSTPERVGREREVMNLMNIHHLRNRLIGDVADAPHKAITLNERRRLCVAMELLTQPQFIYIDFPTFGLSVTEAHSFCLVLKNLVLTGVCAVVCTLHDPTKRVFDLFDKVILLRGGQVVFEGPSGDALEHFPGVYLEVPNDREFRQHSPMTLTEQSLLQLNWGNDRQRLMKAREERANAKNTSLDSHKRGSVHRTKSGWRKRSGTIYSAIKGLMKQ